VQAEITARGGGRRRGSVSAESTSDMLKARQSLQRQQQQQQSGAGGGGGGFAQTAARRAQIGGAMRRNLLFAKLDEATLGRLCDSMVELSCVSAPFPSFNRGGCVD
jgi:hypothetical protein